MHPYPSALKKTQAAKALLPHSHVLYHSRLIILGLLLVHWLERISTSHVCNYSTSSLAVWLLPRLPPFSFPPFSFSPFLLPTPFYQLLDWCISCRRHGASFTVFKGGMVFLLACIGLRTFTASVQIILPPDHCLQLEYHNDQRAKRTRDVLIYALCVYLGSQMKQSKH